jgi:membrane protein implicated in regulation of membrane protease activity
MWCHLLLMSPILGLGLFLILPWTIALPLYLAVIALSFWLYALPLYLVVIVLSIWLYAKIMASMRRPVTTGGEGLLGRVAELGPGGSLMVRSERWLIAPRDGLTPGQRVRIIGLEGLRLKVQPVDQGT